MFTSILRYRMAVLCALGIILLSLPISSFAGKEPKKRVAVVGFENKSGVKHTKHGSLGGGLTEKLTEALTNTEKFVVLERQELQSVLAEQNLLNVQPRLVGRLTSAQALIRGVITNVESAGGEEAKGIPLGKVRLGVENLKTSVRVNLRIIDTVTGQVLQSKTVEGLHTKRGIRLRDKKGGSLKIDRGQSLSKALDKAVKQAVKQIVNGMEKSPWQGSISRVSGRQLIVNAGSQENVESGLQLRVFERGAEIIDQDTNETLGRLDEEIGIIRVIRVEPRFAVTEVVQGQGFAKGNLVRPLSPP